MAGAASWRAVASSPGSSAEAPDDSLATLGTHRGTPKGKGLVATACTCVRAEAASSLGATSLASFLGLAGSLPTLSSVAAIAYYVPLLNYKIRDLK